MTSSVAIPLLVWAPASNAQSRWQPTPVSPRPQSVAVFHDVESRFLCIDSDGNTWALEQRRWRRLASVSAGPRIRFYTAATYDSDRGVVVVYDGPSGETWEYVGGSWLQRTTTSPVPARDGSALAYDPVRQRTVLHGGVASTTLADTWEWDSVSWSLADTSGPARTQHSMAFDPVSGSLLLYGGAQAPTSTYLRVGTTWQLQPGAGPATPFFGRLGIDRATQRVVLVTANLTPQFTSASLWSWSGNGWSLVANGPSDYVSPNSTRWIDTDPTTGDLVGVLGLSNASVWRFDGVTWSFDRDHPPFVDTMVYDRGRSRFVVPSASDEGLTFERQRGGAWVAVDTPSLPFRVDATATYDEQRAVTILFGGTANSSSQPADLWERGSGDWLQVDPGTGPSGRCDHAAAYDSDRGELVLFGGRNGVRLGDTWTWNGSTWTEHIVPNGPRARWHHAMAYDGHRREVVLFGGSDGGRLGDTWTWDGTTWTERFPPTAPSPRSEHGMVYDPTRRRVILHGGLAPVSMVGDTWEYDGRTWLRISDLEPRERNFLVFDSELDRVTLWERYSSADLEYDRLETGCSALAPDVCVDEPRPAPGDVIRIDIDGLPSTGTAFHLLGFGPAAPGLPVDSIGIAGCDLLLDDPLLTTTHSLDVFSSGTVDYSIPIPTAPTTIGVRFALQSLVLSSGALTLSDASIVVVAPPPPP